MRSRFWWAALALVAVLAITTAASATTRGLITGKQIAPHTIDSKHLVNHTIQAHDLSSGLIKSLHGAKGARGPQGPAGPQGATGRVGAVGPRGADGRPGVTSAVERLFTWDTPLPIASGRWPDVEPTHVLTIHLGSGAWAVTGEVIASNYTGQGIVLCSLAASEYGPVVGNGQSAVGNTGGYAVQQTFGLQGTVTLDVPTDLELTCINNPPSNPVGDPNIRVADVIATQMNNVSRSPEGG